MCGHHTADGTPIGHHHHDGPVFWPRPRTRPRRAFLGDVGKGAMALAIFSPVVAACSGDNGSGTTSAGTDSTSTSRAQPSLQWGRTDLGFVSAYVLVRGTEAAIVDTGSAGSAPTIGDTLAGFGLTYADVTHVVLTHHHPDHVGSIDAVLAEATGATAHAGELDLDEIARDTINPLTGGEDVFGLEVIATPGHTEGHMAVIDHDAGLLVAGDALNTPGGAVQGANPDFTRDMDTANDSIRRLAELSFNTLLVGHGEPVETNADTAVADLAASLT